MNEEAFDKCRIIICNKIRELNPDSPPDIARIEVGEKIIEALQDSGWTLKPPIRLRRKVFLWLMKR